ncbi:hypothetical protein HOS75_gp064 [Gordonia phage SteveFrench]|uniref:DUF1508 domain-containing protein n=1 Tax=Gordonia phage SteveFrench TaxID=2079281 RepID=A0A2K9VEG7_9CAUD|nr:hypothetical protein HOS75_gp064 [Gordonia phage SteveFrench]AUV60666.1 hypothetical protein SEA_STEVEFRENCH_64 [Gordonia phage SteveFrench]
MRRVRIERGGTYSRPAAHRWYWRITDANGNGRAESVGSFDSPKQAVDSVNALLPDTPESFQWLIGGTPRDKAIAFTSTPSNAARYIT